MTDIFYPIFNIIIGIIMILLATKIYVPKFKSDETKENFYKKKDFFLVGGIALLLWGLIKLL